MRLKFIRVVACYILFSGCTELNPEMYFVDNRSSKTLDVLYRSINDSIAGSFETIPPKSKSHIITVVNENKCGDLGNRFLSNNFQQFNVITTDQSNLKKDVTQRENWIYHSLNNSGLFSKSCDNIYTLILTENDFD